MRELLTLIERVLPDGGEWCTPTKAHTLAALIVGLKPETVLEVGVWMGGSAIPMALALKHNGFGRLIAIDPWNASESAKGQEGANRKWWAGVDHNKAYDVFVRRVRELELEPHVDVWRMTSDDATMSEALSIGLLHVDGNHSEQAIRDVEKFAPHVRVGGIVVMDDISWQGGAVATAVDHLVSQGFEKISNLDTGAVFQRSLPARTP